MDEIIFSSSFESNLSISTIPFIDNKLQLSTPISLNVDYNFSSVSSIQIEVDELERQLTKKKRKRKKRKRKNINLVKMPLPLFDCIYCVKKGLLFNYFIQRKMKKKYNKVKADVLLDKLQRKVEIFESINLLNKTIYYTTFLSIEKKEIKPKLV